MNYKEENLKVGDVLIAKHPDYFGNKMEYPNMDISALDNDGTYNSSLHIPKWSRVIIRKVLAFEEYIIDIFSPLGTLKNVAKMVLSPEDYDLQPGKLTEEGEGGGGGVSGGVSASVGGDSIGGGANFSSNVAPDVPEHLRKIVDPSGQLLEFQNKAKKLFRESIIDVPQKNYCKDVLDSNDKMNSQLRLQIIRIIRDWKNTINIDFDIYKIYAKGSLFTKRYNDTSDLDVSIYTSLNKEEVNNIYISLPKDKVIKGTQHPIDLYLLAKEDKLNYNNFDNLYDIANDKWVKRSDEYDNPIPLSYLSQVSQFFIDGCVLAINSYENHRSLYEYYLELDKNRDIPETEKQKFINKKKEELQEDLDAMRLALHMLKAFRKEAYAEDDSELFQLTLNIESINPHCNLGEQLSKLLDKYGIIDKLRQSIKDCEELLN